MPRVEKINKYGSERRESGSETVQERKNAPVPAPCVLSVEIKVHARLDRLTIVGQGQHTLALTQKFLSMMK